MCYMLEPFFSIVTPVYNTEEFLPRLLDSFLDQSFGSEKVEIIIVNDASPNEVRCSEVISIYNKRLNIQYIKLEENKGTHVARINGVKCVKGKYILFVDPDDYLEYNALEIIYNDIKNNGDVDYIEFNYYELTKQSKTRHASLYSYTALERDGLLWNLDVDHTLWRLCLSSGLAKKSYDVMECFYACYTEDYYQVGIIKTFAKTKRIIDEPLYVYVLGMGITAPQKYELEKLKKIILSIYNVDKNLILFYQENGYEKYITFIREYSKFLYFFFMHHSNIRDFIEVCNEMLDKVLVWHLMSMYLLEIKNNVEANQKNEMHFLFVRYVMEYFVRLIYMPNRYLYKLLTKRSSFEEIINIIATNFGDNEVDTFFWNYLSWSNKRLWVYKEHTRFVFLTKKVLKPFCVLYKWMFRIIKNAYMTFGCLSNRNF